MKLLNFDVQFDGTDMPMHEIQREARKRGWAGIRLDADDFRKTGKRIVRRLSKRCIYPKSRRIANC